MLLRIQGRKPWILRSGTRGGPLFRTLTHRVIHCVNTAAYADLFLLGSRGRVFKENPPPFCLLNPVQGVVNHVQPSLSQGLDGHVAKGLSAPESGRRGHVEQVHQVLKLVNPCRLRRPYCSVRPSFPAVNRVRRRATLLTFDGLGAGTLAAMSSANPLAPHRRRPALLLCTFRLRLALTASYTAISQSHEFFHLVDH